MLQRWRQSLPSMPLPPTIQVVTIIITIFLLILIFVIFVMIMIRNLPPPRCLRASPRRNGETAPQRGRLLQSLPR